MPEARLEDSGSGLVPAGEGWFVVKEETPDPKQAYAPFERAERGRPSYWDGLPWA